MPPPISSDAAAIDSVNALGEGTRRQMFAFIRRARHPVTRDEAAATVGISRELAAFHLDKLVDVGLLSARYAAPTGVREVGRQPKVYEPTVTPSRVSIPDRRHELLADLLVQAVVTEGETRPPLKRRCARQDSGAKNSARKNAPSCALPDSAPREA
ncbi:hypothetical protein [Streptomyces canus]|uniref:hypothetical protein n=1 Tax=Streptomyces canus TaxID=58343 RepID=UPI00039FB22A|nr:hypothetical protein [Streptomyces canus]